MTVHTTNPRALAGARLLRAAIKLDVARKALEAAETEHRSALNAVDWLNERAVAASPPAREKGKK